MFFYFASITFVLMNCFIQKFEGLTAEACFPSMHNYVTTTKQSGLGSPWIIEILIHLVVLDKSDLAPCSFLHISKLLPPCAIAKF